MSRRARGKSAHTGSDRGRLANKHNIGSEVFRNSSAVCDDTDPHQSLKYLNEIFQGKIEEDVISMIFSECAFNVDQSLETLMSLSSDEHEQQPTTTADQQPEISDNYVNLQQMSNQSVEEVPVFNIDANTFHVDNNYINNSDSSSNRNFISFSSPDQSLLSIKSSKNEPHSVNSYPSAPTYSSLFSSSNLVADSIPTSTFRNFSQGSSIQFDKTVPEYSPKLMYNNCWASSLNYGTPKKHKDSINQPKSNSHSKKNNKKPSLEDLKWKEDANRLRYARDLIESGFMVLVLLRGLPGSGKSTLAKTLKFSGVVLSTDDFFGQNGEYNFDPRYLQEAHEWNKKRALTALFQSVSPVIIDNTNTEYWEMAPYVKMGKKFNYNIVILEPLTAWKFKPSELVRRNHHGVRKEAIVRMLDRYQHDITVESFAENLDVPMPKHNKMLVSDISLPNNLHINPSSNVVKEEVKTSNQLVSLEAVIHQEEKSNDTLLEEDIEETCGSETTNPKMLLTNESLLPLENKNILFSTKCPKCTEKADALENIALTTKTKTFESLEELKSLVQEDSDDTLSLCNDCILLQASVDEDFSWEEVTEHDTDFLWKTPVQENSSNSSISSIQLQNDFSLLNSSADINADTSKLNENSSEHELLLKPILQRDLSSELTEKVNNVSVLDSPVDTFPGKATNVSYHDSKAESTMKQQLSEDTFSGKTTNVLCYESKKEAARKQQLSEETLPGKTTNVSCHDSKKEATVKQQISEDAFSGKTTNVSYQDCKKKAAMKQPLSEDTFSGKATNVSCQDSKKEAAIASMKQHMSEDIFSGKATNVTCHDIKKEAAMKQHLSEDIFSGKATNVSSQDNNNEAAVADNNIVKISNVSLTKTAPDNICLDLMSLKDDNYEHKQENHELYQNLNLKLSTQKFDNSISSKYENSHRNNLVSESDNEPKSYPMKLSSQSFDESLVFRESKTKETEKNIGTNLLRSKFHSVPILEDVDKNSVENAATAALNSSSEAVEKDTDFKKSVKSCLGQGSASSDNHLWISDDLDEISWWSNKEMQNVNSNSNKPKINLPIRDKDCNQNLISNANSSSDSMHPKPQKSNLKTNLTSANNFKENNNSHKLLTLINDCSEKDAVSDWGDSVETEQASRNSGDISDDCLQTPKPQKNISKFNNMANFSLDNKFVDKGDELGDLTSSPITSQNSQRHQKKGSPLLKHVEIYLNKDWTFPQFVSNNSDTVVIPEKTPISNYTAETQTEPSDFVQIYKMETCNYISNFRILTPSANIYKNFENNTPQNFDFDAVPTTARFEKSTCTDDLIVETEVSDKMDTLRECFPDISEDDLSHLLDLCHEDEAWMINLLLDSGYKYNNPNSEEVARNSVLRNSPKLDEESVETQDEILGNANETEESCKIENEDVFYSKSACNIPESISSEGIETLFENEINSEKASNFASSRTFGKMHLILDSAFAMQLEELFGQVEVAAVPSSPSERAVEIDLEFAKLIYNKWKNITESEAPINSAVVNDTKYKKSRNQPLSKYTPHKNTSVTPQNSSEPISFSEIMDREYALQVHKTQKLKKDEDFATKLKRIELYNMFPGADTIALDEIFESNNCSLKNSVIALGEDLGEPHTSESESEFKKIESNDDDKSKILQEFESNDWSDWVFKECHLDSGSESLPASIPPEAADLRREAAEHCVLRQNFIQKAQEAHGRGMGDVASFYAQKGREHALKFKEASKAACDLIVQKRNSTTSSQVLDLHGLFVQEAIPYVDEFLKAELQKRPQNSLTKVSIITGQGNNSIRGPKLGPSVMEYLKKLGYRFAEVNRGILEVYLKCE